MAYLYKRTIRIYDGPRDPEDFYNENYLNDEYPCLEPTNSDIPYISIQQYCPSMEELGDVYEDFRVRHLRINDDPDMTFVVLDEGFSPNEGALANLLGKRSEEFMALASMAVRSTGPLSSLIENFRTTIDRCGLEYAAVKAPTDSYYIDSITFTESELASFDLSRFYSLEVWFETIEIEDSEIGYFAGSGEERQSEQKEFLILGPCPQKVSLPISVSSPAFAPIFLGDLDELYENDDTLTMLVGYAAGSNT